MPRKAIFQLYGKNEKIHSYELDDAFIPRLGDIIYIPEYPYKGNDCYVTADMRYSIIEGNFIAEISLIAESSHHKGVTGIHEQMMIAGAWDKMLESMNTSPAEHYEDPYKDTPLPF